jgi:hypothetical protein
MKAETFRLICGVACIVWVLSAYQRDWRQFCKRMSCRLHQSPMTAQLFGPRPAIGQVFGSKSKFRNQRPEPRPRRICALPLY